MFPDDRGDAGEIFDARVSDTPREQIARVIYHASQLVDPRNSWDRLEDGRVAAALLLCYRLEHLLRTVDRLQVSVENGAFDRPSDGDPVSETKEAAIAELETLLEGPSYPHLVRYLLREVSHRLSRGDQVIEEGGYPSDMAAVSALGNYAFALELARTIPETAEWFVAALE